MSITKVAFFGSSAYSVLILKKLLELPDFSVPVVVTKSDKPVGRNQVITQNPVAKFAQTHHLPLLQPEEFTPEFKSEIRQLSLDIGLCVAYGPPFFDQELIDIFPLKIVNIHPSRLPIYRGATPGPWQIINGETKSAISFFQIDALPDHGPIISQINFDISSQETSETFYTKAFALASDNLESILKSYIINPKSMLQPQDHSQKSYYPKFNKATSIINWSWEPQKIDRFIRAMIPWPIAWTFITDQKGVQLTMKIFSATLDSKLKTLTPVSVQVEGKKITNWDKINKYYSIIKD